MAVPVELPAVVLALEPLSAAARLFGQEAVPVRADVEEGPELAIEVAEQDGRFEQIEGEEVAGPGQLTDRRDRMPGG